MAYETAVVNLQEEMRRRIVLCYGVLSARLNFIMYLGKRVSDTLPLQCNNEIDLTFDNDYSTKPTPSLSDPAAP